MKKITLFVLAGLLLIGGVLYAANGDLIVNGNVGIGTANPGAKLDVNGEIKTLSGATGYYGIGSEHPGTGDADADRPNLGTSIPVQRINYHTGLSFSAHSYYGGIRFYNQGYSGTESNPYKLSGPPVMTITNGNVGIGTTNPGVPLEVAATSQRAVIRLNSLGDGDSQNSDLRFAKGGADLWAITARPNDINNNFVIWRNNGNWTSDFNINWANGNIGIGTTNPGSYKLYIAGTAYSTGGWQGSDIKFKKNLQSINDPVNKVLHLNGVSYEWRTDEFKDKGFPEGRHYGVIAQEIEKVLPEIVNTAPDGTKAVAYTEIIPVLIEAIKEQQKEIEELKKIVAEKK